VRLYTAPDQFSVLKAEQTLDGGDVLPGLSLPLQTIFSRVPQKPAKAARRKGTARSAKHKPRKANGAS
jgi:hypothetical protein